LVLEDLVLGAWCGVRRPDALVAGFGWHRARFEMGEICKVEDDFEGG
jgi:hypothetical protein